MHKYQRRGQSVAVEDRGGDVQTAASNGRESVTFRRENNCESEACKCDWSFGLWMMDGVCDAHTSCFAGCRAADERAAVCFRTEEEQ